jgi:predicted amidophosphoribosyltransferase
MRTLNMRIGSHTTPQIVSGDQGFCAYCGGKLVEGGTFCPGCGHRINPV